MNTRVIAGIDQGTTGTRTNLYDESGARLSTAYERVPIAHPRAGWDEQDPEALLGSIKHTLEAALSEVDHPELVAIGLANVGESIVAFDTETGEALTPAIVWSDRRASELTDQLRGTEQQEVLEQRSGLPLDSYFPAAKFAWLYRHDEGVREAARKGRLGVGTLDPFFIYRLSTERLFVSDASTATRTQLTNLETRRFDSQCAGVFGFDLEHLPEVIPSVFPEPIETTLGAPLTASIVDQMAALGAIGAIQSESLKVTYGTGCFMEANAGPEPVRPAGGLIPFVASELAQGEPTYAIEGGVFTAAAAVDWLVSIGLADSVHHVDQLASRGALGELLFLPAFSGIAAPWWRPRATGIFAGLRASTRREDIALAVLEGIAHLVSDVLEGVEASQGLPAEIRIDGGLSASAPLVQLQADLTGRPILVSTERESTAAGAAGFAAIGIGDLDLEGLAARARFHPPVEPRMTEAQRAERRGLWREFVTGTASLDSDPPPRRHERGG